MMKIKKSKRQKKVCYKKTHEDYKSCLKVDQIENKIDNLEKNKIDVDNL